MKAREVVSLGVEDWSKLMPVRVVKLGGKSVEVTPVTVAEVAKIAGHVQRWLRERPDRVVLLKEIDLEHPEKLLELLDDDLAPVVEMLTGVAAKDFLRLPVWAQLELLDAVVDVNLKGLDALKNLQSLAEAVNKIAATVRGSEA